MRALRVLRQAKNEVKELSSNVNAPKRRTDPDPFKYHTKPPSAFWEKVRQKLVLNPESTSGMPLNEINRWPPPGSIETVQVTPASKASDPAENPYHERDFRRKYPRLEMITQSDIVDLLIAAPDQLKLPKVSKDSSTTTSIVSSSDKGKSLSNLYLSSPNSNSNLANSSDQFKPPTPPGKPYHYKRVETPPHPKHAYFPMINYS